MQTMTEFHRQVAADIERVGRSITCVCGGPDGELPFAYTIGNSLRWVGLIQSPLPELLVIGVFRDVGWLNDLSRLMIAKGAAFDDGQEVRLLGSSAPLKIIDAGTTARTQYAVQAGEHFGHEHYPIMQVLIPDKNGKFPDAPDCQPPYSEVPVLHDPVSF